jgi:hypothetical protein
LLRCAQYAKYVLPGTLGSSEQSSALHYRMEPHLRRVEMWIFGIIGGFIIGFIASQLILMVVLSGSRHLALQENPKLKTLAGLFGISIMLAGAYADYIVAT